MISLVNDLAVKERKKTETEESKPNVANLFHGSILLDQTKRLV